MNPYIVVMFCFPSTKFSIIVALLKISDDPNNICLSDQNKPGTSVYGVSFLYASHSLPYLSCIWRSRRGMALT